MKKSPTFLKSSVLLFAGALSTSISAAPNSDASPPATADHPSPPPAASEPPAWMNTASSAGERADALLAAMTLDQKLQQIYNFPVPNAALQNQQPPCQFQPVGRHIEGIPQLGSPGVVGAWCQYDPYPVRWAKPRVHE
jgi:hypothetical protein